MGGVFVRRIALTMGDPAGIGPEILLKAVARLKERLQHGSLSLVLIGCHATFMATSQALSIPIEAGLLQATANEREWRHLAFVDTGPGVAITAGRTSAEAGQTAYAAIDKAVELALAGQIAAICTAPLSKQSLNMAGHAYAGHTELLRDLTNSRDSVMMLAHGNMRVSHVSTHCALADVPAKLTSDRLSRVVQLTSEALVRLGVERPRLAVAALNPHGGEGGLFGTEDDVVTAPTVARLRSEGHDVVGPLPGDTIFVKLRAGQFDAVVAMYHDQGHIPVKLLGFEIDPATGQWKNLSGVNITLGLPIIRTSVDHGTA